ncbi:MAG: ribonuclease P protein component, partial [Oligoflexia bacterium]|nr:ribonuclease P protein component [Oligoflexia bacterium]
KSIINSYGKNYRLRSIRDFSYLRADCQKSSTRYLTLYFKESRLGQLETRMGSVISRKVGKANIRNRFKRLLREAFRLSDYKNNGFDFVLIVSPFLVKNFDKIEDSEIILKQDFKRVLIDASRKMKHE